MSLITYKIVSALLIFLMSMVAVIYPLKTKNIHAESFELGEAFASGIFLGVAFFHMLPNAIHTFQMLYNNLTYPIAEVICITGFLLLLFIERLSFVRFSCDSTQAIPYVLALILIIHSLVEGAALGIGRTFTESLIIFTAIITHKGSASFALCITLMRYHFSLSRILFIILLFSLMTPIGIGLGTLISLGTQSRSGLFIEAIFDAFAAGTFLYMSTLHHIRFHREEAQNLLQFACLTLGLVVMGIVALSI